MKQQLEAMYGGGVAGLGGAGLYYNNNYSYYHYMQPAYPAPAPAPEQCEAGGVYGYPLQVAALGGAKPGAGAGAGARELKEAGKVSPKYHPYQHQQQARVRLAGAGPGAGDQGGFVVPQQQQQVESSLVLRAGQQQLDPSQLVVLPQLPQLVSPLISQPPLLYLAPPSAPPTSAAPGWSIPTITSAREQLQPPDNV